jgi:hypothetical protein
LSLSSLDIVTIVAAVIVLLAYGYAAFWALNIRRNLKVGLYRHQALGIGLVAICVAYFTFFSDGGGNYLPAAFSEYPITGIVFFSFLACLAPLLYLTDSSILAARDSDPLQRDVLGWGRIRIPLWGALAACLVGGGAYVVYQTIFLSQQTALAGNSTYLVGVPGIIGGIAVIVPLVLPPASAVIFLSVAVRRTRDLTLRRHLKWFGIGAALFGLGALLDILLTPVEGSSFLYPIVFMVLFVGSAYSFYRSARATIPMYSFTEGAS